MEAPRRPQQGRVGGATPPHGEADDGNGRDVRAPLGQDTHALGARLSAGARILIVEDDPDIRFFLEEDLRDLGYDIRSVEDGGAALSVLKEDVFDVVLLDIHLPVVDGIGVLSAGRMLQTGAKFIMMTAFGKVETALQAMKLGAYDYLRKPLTQDELRLVIERALRETSLEREVAALRRQTQDARAHGIVGRSAAIRRLFDLIERVAPTRATVIVVGETGTGKELVARAIHRLSPRASRPFVPVNCSALPETLLESELFGHMKGSFTGAFQTKRGLFEEAAGGTLFLDEVSALSPNTQVKLLRVLQERKVKRIGGREEIPVDFRLIAATNEDLEGLVHEGGFREDLFYRLNVFPVQVPPLRDRSTDIPLLASHFRLKVSEENEIEAPRFNEETLARMCAYSWPGNVRELENFVERAVIMHAGAETIPFDLTDWNEAEAWGGELLDQATEEGWELARLEREFILMVLDRMHWRKAAAARVLGVNRRTLYRRLKTYRQQGFLEDVDLESYGGLSPSA